MPRRLAVLAFAAAVVSAEAHAHAPTTLWVELPTAADRERARAAGLGWAEGRDGDWYRLSGTPERAEAAGLRWRADAAAPDAWAPSPEEVATRLGALDAVVTQIGESVEGRPILAARFGSGPRAVRVLGGHHGDEGSSVEVALRVAEALDDDAVALPAGTEVWVVPAVNPDGLAAGSRYNARGVDLNRNYDVEWSTAEPYGGAGPFSEPETRAVRALARARSFDAGLSLHSGAQNIGWVWNWSTETRPVEEPLLVELAAAYADETAAPGFWITNGADWYVTFGDLTDWAYGRWGAYDFTLELTTEKSPPADAVDAYVGWHLDAVLAWIATPPDVGGLVVDDRTGEPVPAVVRAEGSMQPLTTGPGGGAARFLDGDAPLVVSAPGYAEAPFAEEIRLEPVEILDTLPSPRLLSRGGGPVRVTLAGVTDGPLVLSQPGEAPVTVAADGGGWTVDPEALAPGAWTLATEAGVVPRGLFVGEVDDRVTLSAAALDGAILTLDGENFAPGAEAWSIGGPARALRPLARLSEDDGRLVFLADGDGDDVLVWVNGAWLAAVDLRGTPTVDLTPPEVEREPVAEAEPEEPEGLEVEGACATGPATGGVAVAAAVALASVRRRREASHSGTRTARGAAGAAT